MKRTFGRSNVFWGVALILTALLIVFDAVGKNLGFVELPLFRIILCVLIAAWGVSELIKGRFAHIFLPLGFIFAILQRNIAGWVGHVGPALDENGREVIDAATGVLKTEPKLFVSTWIVILAALLLQIGFSVILPKRKTVSNGHLNVEGKSRTEEGEGYFENDLGASACYIDAAKLGSHRVENNLGKLDVYIENAEAYASGGVIEVENDLGQTVIHIPEGWAVDNRIETSLGSVSCSVPAQGSPMITLTGSCDLGNVNIV